MNAHEYMSRVRDLEDRITRLKEEFSALRSAGMEVGSISRTKSLREEGTGLTVMEDMTVTRMELEKALQEDNERYRQVYAEVKETIRECGFQLKDWDLQSVLESYYLFHFPMDVVASCLHRNIRTAYRYRREALAVVQRVLDEREQTEGGDLA